MENLELIEAVKADNLARARDLVEAGAEINQQDENGWTPLNWAAGKGNLALVTLLLEKGADVFKVGRDQRTPYKIALAAGRVEVVKLLRQAEENTGGENLSRSERKYCKAYHLRDLRRFPVWAESKINWKENGDGGSGSDSEDALTDDSIVYLHQDLTVTKSMWHNENVIFNQVTPQWEEFCTQVLTFKVPDDLDFIVSSERAAADTHA